ncbi:unnamed protein product [Symbiodinium sp. KB8]|nr:unnamed protein product [Symbiodinium sp. KB8]
MLNIYVTRSWLRLYTRNWEKVSIWRWSTRGLWMNSTRRLVKIYAQNLAAVVIMKERMGLMKSEENALQEEANKRVLAMESGARDLQSRLDREEVARSEATLKMEQAEVCGRGGEEDPGTKGDGKIYLNDDGEACKIDKRGVPYRRERESTTRPSGKEQKKQRKDRKRAAVGKKVIDRMLDKMVFPKIVQCDKIDLELASCCTEGWEWAQESVQQQLQEEFLEDITPAVPASSVFNEDWIPAMPCTTSLPPKLRVKNTDYRNCFSSMVTLPVTRKEMISNPKAMEAFMKEWKGLWDQEVFDFTQTREYDDVKKGQKVHMVKDQNMEAALFQDLGNSLATLDASRRSMDIQTQEQCGSNTGTPQYKRLLLVSYVDDLKMAGPKEQLPAGWTMLRKELRLEEETTPLGLYLGCRISKGEAVLHDKTHVQTVTYDMETCLDMTVKEYCDVTGFDPAKFRMVPSPGPAGETKNHPARAPVRNGKSHRCTWCGHTMPVDEDGRLIPPPPVPKRPTEEEVD